jgi:hypothetical protein
VHAIVGDLDRVVVAHLMRNMFSGNHQQSVAIISNQWQSVTITSNQWQSSAISGNQWQSPAISGNHQQPSAISCNPWQFMAPRPPSRSRMMS